MLDIIIRNGMILDGSGKPGFRADLAISGGRIKGIGHYPEAQAVEVIDAEGLVVCPGFIDLHSHADLYLLRTPTDDEKVLQGVTTEIVGNCGLGVAPVPSRSLRQLLKSYVSPTLGEFVPEWGWESFGDYLTMLENARPSPNVGVYASHGALRLSVLGFDDRPPTESELSRMKSALALCMEEGALGLTTGLIYVPGCFAAKEELMELCRVIAAHDRVYASHIRNESDMLVESVLEALEVGRHSGSRVHISHHKASGMRNWGKVNKTLELLERATEAGVRASCDLYPYTAGSSTITVLLPQWALQGGIVKLLERLEDPETRGRIKREIREGIPGWECLVRDNGWENIVVSWVASEKNKGVEWKSLAQIAREKEMEPDDVVLELIAEEQGRAAIVIFQQCEDDLATVMRYRGAAIGSDSLYGGELPHPRRYGTFPRVLARYAREKKVFPLQEAVRKMTTLPAEIIGLKSMGSLERGYWADIAVFDPVRVIDTATYERPTCKPEGIAFVVVSGTIVVRNGMHTGARPGRILRFL